MPGNNFDQSGLVLRRFKPLVLCRISIWAPRSSLLAFRIGSPTSMQGGGRCLFGQLRPEPRGAKPEKPRLQMEDGVCVFRYEW